MNFNKQDRHSIYFDKRENQKLEQMSYQYMMSKITPAVSKTILDLQTFSLLSQEGKEDNDHLVEIDTGFKTIGNHDPRALISLIDLDLKQLKRP